MNPNKNLLSEINRIREIMSLPLLIENLIMEEGGGPIKGIIDNLFIDIANKSVRELDPEQLKAIDNIIDNAPAGSPFKAFANSADALSAAKKADFIDALRSNSDEVVNSLKTYSKNMLEARRTLILNMGLDFSSLGTDLKNKIETFVTDGLDGYSPAEIVMFRNELIQIANDPSIADDIKKGAATALDGIDNKLDIDDITPQKITNDLGGAEVVDDNKFFDEFFDDEEINNVLDSDDNISFLDKKLTQLENGGYINLGKTDRQELLAELNRQMGDKLKNLKKFDEKWNKLSLNEKVKIFNKIKQEMDKLVSEAKNPEIKKGLKEASNWWAKSWEFMTKERKGIFKFIKGYLYMGAFAALYGCAAKQGIQGLIGNETDYEKKGVGPTLKKCFFAGLAGPFGILYYIYELFSENVGDLVNYGQYEQSPEGLQEFLRDYNEQNPNSLATDGKDREGNPIFRVGLGDEAGVVTVELTNGEIKDLIYDTDNEIYKFVE